MKHYPIVHPLHPLNEKSEDLLEIVEGVGIYVKDRNGKVYMDGISGLWNVTMGYNHDQINQAIIEQLGKISYVNLGEYRNEASIQFSYASYGTFTIRL